MRKTLTVCCLLLLMVVPGTVEAEVGIGIPDMVGEQVEELDKEVRKFRARQPVFDELNSFLVRVSTADSDFVSHSTISPDLDDHRLYLTLNVNRPTDKSLFLLLSDGEGTVQSDFELSSTLPSSFNLNTDTATVDHLAYVDDQVHALINVPTGDSGPQSLVHFRQAEDVSKAAFPPGFTLSNGTVPVTVNTLAYGSGNDMYLAGDSGVFKVDRSTAVSQWGFRHLDQYRMQDGNIVTLNDTPYISSVYDSPTGLLVQTAALRPEGGTVAWSDTI
ncbi:MAG: hypothetical protein ABEK50_13680, partial [bacterium]